MRNPLAGFRYFKCDECGTQWRTPSRDCYSPSGEVCPVGDKDKCEASWYGALEVPYKGEPREDWPTKDGNLLPNFDYENFEAGL